VSQAARRTRNGEHQLRRQRRLLSFAVDLALATSPVANAHEASNPVASRATPEPVARAPEQRYDLSIGYALEPDGLGLGARWLIVLDRFTLGLDVLHQGAAGSLKQGLGVARSSSTLFDIAAGLDVRLGRLLLEPSLLGGVGAVRTAICEELCATGTDTVLPVAGSLRASYPVESWAFGLEGRLTYPLLAADPRAIASGLVFLRLRVLE
jgi:hypothetical protein